MKYIANCSFGKDSLAAIIVSVEHGIFIDKAVYSRVMFDDDISAEYPEHEEFIHGKAIPLLEKRYGIKTDIVQADTTYVKQFFKVFSRGKRKGKIYGFPFLKGPWCNSNLKIRPIKRYEKSYIDEELIKILGIAYDEQNRIKRGKSDKIYPLVTYQIIEKEAFNICKKNDLLSPAYNENRTRLGCWFCHNQRISQLKYLRKKHPELWEKLMQLDLDSPCRFKANKTLHDIELRLKQEDQQQSLFK